MKKFLAAATVGCLMFSWGGIKVNAQETIDENTVLDGAYKRIHTVERKPLPYQYVREADVMWSKKIWRKIDLREKMNHILYYPERPIEDDGEKNVRMSLASLLMHAIENEGLRAFHPSADEFNEFKEEITMEAIKERFGAVDEVLDIENDDGTTTQRTIKGEVNTTEVKEFLIKEEWFFDKQRSVLEVRIIGICPIRKYYKPEDMDQEDPQFKKLFWVYFPEAREHFANHKVFNFKNEAQHNTFEDIFEKRYFASYIVQESNTYNNRLVNQYTMGVETLLEAERIKERIFNFELDLWEY